MLTALFIGLGSIGTRHLKNLTAICAQRGLALRADALRSDLARPLRPGAAELLHSQFTTLQDSAALPHYDLAFITNPTSLHAQALEAGDFSAPAWCRTSAWVQPHRLFARRAAGWQGLHPSARRKQWAFR